MALAWRPEVLIADEPTSSLDVMFQADMLSQLRWFYREYRASVILITQGMGIVAEMTDQVAVMHAGNIIESAEDAPFLAGPCTPTCRGLSGPFRGWTGPTSGFSPSRETYPIC